jgi:hypothetical protein
MRGLRWTLLLLLLVSACQSTGAGGSSPRGSPSLITQEELAGVPALTVFQAVERLRPAWLRGRVSTIRGASPQRYYAHVFLDGIPSGELEVLNGMNVRDVQEIRFRSASEATTRYGTGYPGGIIEVLTRKGGGG